MDIKRQSTIIYCKDIENSKEFYSKILGFTVEMDMGSVIFFEEGIAIWQLKEGHILTKKLGKNFYNSNQNSFELYFEIRDWQVFVDKIKLLKIDYLHPVHEEKWGQKTIRFFDPDKNIIEVGETLECFVRRMHDEGMSLEEIAIKNEVALDTIKKILIS